MEETNCDQCGGKLLRKSVEYTLLGVNLGRFNAQVCSSCGEQLFDEQESDKITKSAKEKGIWGALSSID